MTFPAIREEPFLLGSGPPERVVHPPLKYWPSWLTDFAQCLKITAVEVCPIALDVALGAFAQRHADDLGDLPEQRYAVTLVCSTFSPERLNPSGAVDLTRFGN